MKHLLMMPLCAVIMFSTACTRGDDSAIQEVPLATYAKFGEGLHNEIEPQGWLKEMLVRQDSGLTSHPEAMSYPFDSKLWVGELERDSESRGADCWCKELEIRGGSLYTRIA